tara:strand:- start:4321 stop:4872 length:552 start_codon:yes stop_codon:yes gene_type:complete
MGGQSFGGKIISEDEERLKFETKKKNGKIKYVNIWLDQVFSVTTDGKEKIYYKVDSTDEDMYSVEEMRLYIYGQQDARANHKTPLPVIVGFSVSAVLGVFLGSKNSALLVVSPVVGTLAGSSTQNNRPKTKYARNEKVLQSPAYIEGYRKGARGKKIFNSIIASVAGGIAGGVVGLISANSQP